MNIVSQIKLYGSTKMILNKSHLTIYTQGETERGRRTSQQQQLISQSHSTLNMYATDVTFITRKYTHTQLRVLYHCYCCCLLI